MYYRNADYFEVGRWTNPTGGEGAKPETVQGRLLASVALIFGPVLAIFVAFAFLTPPPPTAPRPLPVPTG
jgi:hypothetical protein